MDAQQERFEVETAGGGDDDLAVEYAAIGKSCGQRREELREVSVQRLLVAALQQDLVAVAEDERPKAVPLRLELPPLAIWQRGGRDGQHRSERVRERQAHGGILSDEDASKQTCRQPRRGERFKPRSSDRGSRDDHKFCADSRMRHRGFIGGCIVHSSPAWRGAASSSGLQCLRERKPSRFLVTLPTAHPSYFSCEPLYPQPSFLP